MFTVSLGLFSKYVNSFLIANDCIFEGLSQDVGWAELVANLSASPLKEDFQKMPLLARSMLIDSIFKPKRIQPLEKIKWKAMAKTFHYMTYSVIV